MPLPYPRHKESRKDFIDRCMSNDNMQREFRDVSQRYAVCMNTWRNSGKAAKKEGKLHT